MLDIVKDLEWVSLLSSARRCYHLPQHKQEESSLVRIQRAEACLTSHQPQHEP